jgi:predicted nucleic acid-binding protein
LPEQPIVCDTTVLLYLGRVGLFGILPALFDPIYVPEQVALELDMGRLLRRDTIDPQDFAWAVPVSVSQDTIDGLPANRLGAGERAVIAYAHACDGCIAGLDDRQARQLAETLGIQVVGLLGILLRAKQADLIASIRSPLDAIVDQGFRLARDLYQDVLILANEWTGSDPYPGR